VQLFRYIFAAGLLFTIDIILFYLLADILNLNYIAVNSCIFILGSIANYVLSYKWVFLEGNINSHFRNIKVLLLVIFFSLLLSNIQLYAYIEILDIEKLDAKLLSSVIVFAWNFMARKYFVFRC
jgi:putative flippase GtrA